MVEYVMEKCPYAQVIVIDDFWSDENSELKKGVIEGLDIEWADLSNIWLE